MKRLLCLALALGCAVTGGCAQRIELALMAVCVGVDVSAEGVTLTVKSPDYAGERDSEKKGYATLSATGPDWQQAVAALYAQAPVTPQFGQLREVVVSLPSFRYMPPRQLFECLDQLPSIRSHALVTVCPGSAREMIEGMSPEIGKRLSKYLDLALDHFEQTGRIPATSMSCALRDLGGFWRDPVLAYYDGGEYAGALALGSAGQVLLTGREVQLYRLVRGETQAWQAERDGQWFGARLRGRAHLAVETDGGRDTLVLRLPVYLTYSLYGDPPPEGPEDVLHRELNDLLAKLQGVGCDAWGFGCQAVRKYAALGDWLRSGWPERYRQAGVRIELDARLLQQPPP